MHHGPNFRTHADYTQRPATPAISFKEDRPCMLCRARKTSCRRAGKDTSCITCRKRGERCSFLDDPTHESALTHESATASLSGGSPNDCDGLDDLGQTGVGFDTSTILPGDLASDIVQGSLGDHTNDHYSQHPADEDAMYGGFTDERIWGSPPPDETQFASTAIGAGLMQFDGIPLANSQVLHQHDFETPERAAPLPTFEASSNGANSAHEIGIRFSTEPHDGCAQSSNLNDAAFTIDQRPEFQSAYFGLSGESDPYLLRHYLFVQYVYPAFPVISRSQIVTAFDGHFKSASPGHAPLPTYLLAAIYASALPFTAYDDILCVSSVYKKPSAQRLWQIVYDGIQTTLHTPKLSTISSALLYLHKPRVGVQHVSADTSFAWSMIASVVGLATSLALHLDCSSWSIPPWEKRLRRRLWWMTFSEATWRSLLLGRPAIIAPDQWNVSELTSLDFEVGEMLLGLGDDTKANDFAEKLRLATHESDEGMISQRLATLTIIADNIYRCLYTIRATEKLADDLAGSIRAIKPLREELKLWYASLPIYLKTPKIDPERVAPAAPSSAACLKFAYLTLEILLYRALLRPLGKIDLEVVSNAVSQTDDLCSSSDANMTGPELGESLRNEIELIICAAENCARIISTFTVELMSWDFAGFWYALG
ncbi:fungal specific transcription factor domain-containing protein [Colletotrichum lupini]|uniref:Fungal specific transcription factor domain-containing protein n=1 Tax=Colletotrichum lupini TaxID=145971 RepID=A0A9Q8SLB3_9PEZI|nr:fungal specific transcription factor domain-containing protein [Colletotrichum lupini]UQC79218.1 fungal specific transcription factor domain-containing protein [Colletotrichum lupini]